jgi:indolepyruvate ferredoxin oxidoreductase
MVLSHPERNPLPVGHMGAEGAAWIGLAPFTATDHIFQNLGDGTYSHSGSLAIRAAVLAGVNLTYKILLNDAVAMTGGQPVEGALTAGRVVQQVRAEGVSRIVVLCDQPERLAQQGALPAGTELRHRDELAQVQEALRRERGVSVIVYDQTCAAEKRRRRKLNTYPDPDRRIYINPLVCEGCGDCSVQSNCVAIQPLETELGRKRKIDQSACNKDFSCVKGFCPSFATVAGGRPRRLAGTDLSAATPLREPAIRALGDGFDMVIAGIGGTGVVTISALLGMAARIEGLGATLYDMTGLSQKGGQVFSHVRLRQAPQTVVAARVGHAQADVVLACDLIAAAQSEVLDTIGNQTTVIGNSDTIATADFQTHRDMSIPQHALLARIAAVSGNEPTLLAAAKASETLLGDSIAANLIMLGYAWQRGVIPLQRASIEKAIELNGKAVASNLKAFWAGRLATIGTGSKDVAPASLESFIQQRSADLERYWNAAYAKRYADLLNAVQDAAKSLAGGDALSWAVARSAYKLMAYKDEYEVARLYSDGRFREALAQEFQDVRSISIHLAPPLLAARDKRTGQPRKLTFGPWIMPVLSVLARLRALRESPLDLFGRSAERRLERALRDTYLAVVSDMTRTLTAESLSSAIELAGAPLDVRGFGHVKAAAATALLTKLRSLSR